MSFYNGGFPVLELWHYLEWEVQQVIWLLLLKFRFSEKATKTWNNLPLVLTLLSKNIGFAKTNGRFFQILWPSHNVWTLLPWMYKRPKKMFSNKAYKPTVHKAWSVISQFIGTFIIICCSGWIHMGLISIWALDKWWVLPRPVWVQNKTETILGEREKDINILGLFTLATPLKGKRKVSFVDTAIIFRFNFSRSNEKYKNQLNFSSLVIWL